MTRGLSPSTEELAAEVARATADLEPADWLLAGTVFRLLAEGEPVEAERLAAALGREPEEVASALRQLPELHLDERGRVTGFFGLETRETPHRLRVDGRELYGWCAWDALYIPPVLGRSARVESRCPATGEPIALTVTPEGVEDLSPGGAVLSALLRERGFDADVIESFCNFVHFFASEEAAAEWTAEHEGTFPVSIPDAFELGLLHTARMRAALERTQP